MESTKASSSRTTSKKTGTTNKGKVRVFTDGACSGNPGPGGYSAVVLEKESHVVVGGYEVDTTNNRMEIMGAIIGIEAVLKKGYSEIEIHADSAYVVNAIELGWVDRWKKAGWKVQKGTATKNKDLWIRLCSLLDKDGVDIKFIKVRGHDGVQFNEMADEEARRQCNIAKGKAKSNKGGKNEEADW